jgi:site-specific recombinase XerD
VKDLFLFTCYTGLAFSDMQSLTENNIRKGIDGEMWIFTERKKTNKPSNIPLLPQAKAILNKYQNHVVSKNKFKLLPVPSNQKLNAYLKEIADLCGITKNLTVHVGRHTFATTITLSNNVPIETVSKMLGHSDLRTTQIYAKVVEKKVSEDMKALKEKLSLQGQMMTKASGS